MSSTKDKFELLVVRRLMEATHPLHNTVLLIQYDLNSPYSMIPSFVGTLLTQGTLGNWARPCTVVAPKQGGGASTGPAGDRPWYYVDVKAHNFD